MGIAELSHIQEVLHLTTESAQLHPKVPHAQPLLHLQRRN